ncbi:MAG: biopolymer transporter ExbD [Planctomycetales bacterium]|nr:biopolymer transporter ExbD [Planctomycetales bacterium]
MKPRKIDEGDLKMEMTPMIDCVFQLLIFFMICTEIAQSELEMLTLPHASESIPDEKPDKKRMVLNVTKDGKIKFRGKSKSKQQLHDLLALEARIAPKEKDNPALSSKAILIRSDSEAEYKHVQLIMQECATVGIWKLELAAASQKKAKGAD